MEPNHNGWSEYRELFKHLIHKVDQIDTKLEKALIQISKVEERHKFMAAAWGTLGGVLAVVTVFAIKFLG